MANQNDKKNKNQLMKRSFSHGLHTVFISVVVLCIIGVLNYLAFQYPKKFDTTKNKLHTFSEQSEKVMKALDAPLTATFYGNIESKQRYMNVFDNYRKLSSKFQFELVDPTKELIRTKEAGIKHIDTLVLAYKGKSQKVESITEESITNALVKLTRNTKAVVCNIQGHGEQSISSGTAEGFQSVKKGLEDQGYETKEFTLAEQNKIPEDCTSIMMLSPAKALFPNEAQLINAFLDNGGRAVIALEATISQIDQTKELRELLKTWGIDVKNGLIVDLRSRMEGGDASIPINKQYNTGHAITKDFRVPSYFPFARPLDVTNPLPEGIKAEWLSKSSAESWGEEDMASIAKGQVQYNEGVDIKGPITTAVAASGKKKDSKATRETRIVVFGSAQFANNQYSRFGGNLDYILNAISWTLEDESLISIRVKEDAEAKLEMTPIQITLIFWVSVILVPLLISIIGIIIWVRRKKL